MNGNVIAFCVMFLISGVFGRIALTEKDFPVILNEIIAVNDSESVILPEKTFQKDDNLESTVKETKDGDSEELLNTLDISENNITVYANSTDDVADNLIADDDSTPNDNVKESTNGPLILTKFITEGRLEEARTASQVNPELFLGIQSHSGYFTVNKTYNSNLYFWYFPIQNKLVNNTPWIVWLQGGPGASSLSGLFDEVGPFKVNVKKDSLVKNPYSWLQNHSMLFIDNPVGTGFSFTEHSNGFATDMATYTDHLYSMLLQFLQVFPELRTAPLYVAGESYAGKYVPALGKRIHDCKSSPEGNINLKGLIIGNAYVEPGMIAQVTRPFYHFGLLVKEQLDIVQPLVEAFQSDIINNRSVAAKLKWNSLVVTLLYLSHQKQAYNFLQDEMTAGKFESFLRKPDIKEALHVGDYNYSFINFTVNFRLAPDFLSNTRPMLETLLNDYEVLSYCGQLDQMLSCAVTSEYYRRWKWNGSEEFLNATRLPFFIKNRLAGYMKKGGGFTEAVVRGAGHMVPMDAPASAQQLVTRWTHGLPVTRGDPNVDKLAKLFVTSHAKIDSDLTPTFL